MSVIRSAVTGVGAYLPEQIVTNADLAKFVDTTDEWISERTGIRQRHSAPRRPADLATWPSRPPGGRWPPPASTAGRRRPDHRRHHHARPDLPGHRRHRAAQAGRAGLHRLRRPGGLLGLRLRAERRRRLRGARPRQMRPGHRRRGDDPADGLDRPRHLRAVRRRRRRRGGRAARRAGDHGRPRPAGLRPALRRDQDRTCSMSTAARRRPARSATCACRATRCSATPWSTSPRPSPPPAPTPASTVADVDWFVPHQANQRILKGVGDRLGLDENKVISTVADARQHLGRLDPAGARRGDRGRAHQAAATWCCWRPWAAA